MISFPRRRLALLIAAIAMLFAVSACGGEEAFGVEEIETVTSATYDYTIPPGAGLALDAGTPLEILPAELDARVGETIRIVNDDDRGHLVGPWFVGAGETLSQRFASPGEFLGECTVHPSGLITVTISA